MNNNTNDFNLAETQSVIREFLIENGGGTVRDVMRNFIGTGDIPVQKGKPMADTVAELLDGITDVVKSVGDFGATLYKVAAPATTPEIVTCSIPETPSIKSPQIGSGEVLWKRIVNVFEADGNQPLHLKEITERLFKSGWTTCSKTPRCSVRTEIHKGIKKGVFEQEAPNIFRLAETADQNASSPQKKGAATKVKNDIPAWKLASEIFESNGNKPLHVNEITEILLEKGWNNNSVDVIRTVAKILNVKGIFENTGSNVFRLARSADFLSEPCFTEVRLAIRNLIETDKSDKYTIGDFYDACSSKGIKLVTADHKKIVSQAVTNLQRRGILSGSDKGTYHVLDREALTNPTNKKPSANIRLLTSGKNLAELEAIQAELASEIERKKAAEKTKEADKLKAQIAKLQSKLADVEAS